MALSPQPPWARLHLWSRAGLLVCVWFPDSGFDVRAGLLMEAWRGDRLCTNAHVWQLPQQSPGAGPRQTGEGWLVAKGPAWGLRPLSPLFAPLSLVLLLALPLSLKRQPHLVPSRFLQGLAVLGAEGQAWSLPVCSTVSCLTTSRGRLAFSEIILQYTGHGSQTRLLSCPGSRGVP